MLTENQVMQKPGWQARYLIMAWVIQAQGEMTLEYPRASAEQQGPQPSALRRELHTGDATEKGT